MNEMSLWIGAMLAILLTLLTGDKMFLGACLVLAVMAHAVANKEADHE